MKTAVALLALVFALSGALKSLELDALAAQTGTFICCETYAPTQTLFFCVINKSPNFQTFDNNGAKKTFVSGASGLGVQEQRVAAVQPSPTSPFPLGGWKLGDIFIGHSGGKVVKITDASTIINPWITISGESDYARQTVFDRTGTVYDGDLIVSFTTSVYKVQSSGTYQAIVKNSNLKNYEGLDIVPLDPKYGDLSGAILIPQNPNTDNPYNYAWGLTTIAVINQQGSISYKDTGCYTDQVFYVHDYDNFYGCDRASGAVFASPWDKIVDAGLDGEIILMCEQDGYPNYAGLRRMYWDGTKVQQEAVLWSGLSDGFPGHWEHGCFSRGGSANVLPGGFSFCYYAEQGNGAPSTLPTMLKTIITAPKNVLQNYGITGTSNVNNYPATGKPASQAGKTVISFIQDSQNGFYLQIVNGDTGAAATMDMGVQYTGPSDPNMLIRVQNNPTDSYFWDKATGQGRFKWNWNSGGTSGLVLGPVGAITGLRDFSFVFTFYGATGISNIVVAGNTSNPSWTYADNLVISLHRISCKCGDGQPGDDPILKVCDFAAPNSTCCTKDCKFQSASTICQQSTSQCQGNSYCTGSSAACPPIGTLAACNCTPPLFGFNCLQVRCDQVQNCTECNRYPQCNWCCDGTCRSNSTCTKTWPKACPACSPGSCAGTCDCGKCVCPAGRCGTTCTDAIDCRGNCVTAGTDTKIDVCGVCGGNGTSCLGCDGIPFGKVYDACGKCGGNGSSCYDPCPGKTCDECDPADGCGWCKDDNKCHPRDYKCKKGYVDKCHKSLSTSAKLGIGLGAAAVAGIIIAIVVFLVGAAIGSKKGYDAWVARKGQLDAANSNPLYNNQGMSGSNPFHENKRDTGK